MKLTAKEYDYLESLIDLAWLQLRETGEIDIEKLLTEDLERTTELINGTTKKAIKAKDIICTQIFIGFALKGLNERLEKL